MPPMTLPHSGSARKPDPHPVAAAAGTSGAPPLELAAAAAAVAAAVLAAFLPVLRNGFVPLDDHENFLANLAYRGLGAGNLAWMWTARHMGHYIPLAWMTLGGDYLLWGMDPFGYHLTSLLLHLANSLLLLVLAWRLLRLASPRWGRPAARGAVAAGAATAALGFAVHPLRVESVAWVSERRDVLCGFFVLLTVLVYTAAKAAGAAGRQGRRRALLAGACGLYAAALLSKGIAVALPVALVALDAAVLGESGPGRVGRRDWREKLPFAALAAGSAVVTLWASGPVLVPAARLGLTARLAAASYGLVFYLHQTFWPARIPFLIPWLAGVELARPAIAWRAAALVAAAVALFAWRRRSRAWCAVGAAFATYAVFVLPVSGLLQAGPQLVAPRYSYLSCLPWALLAGAALTRFLAGPRRAGGEDGGAGRERDTAPAAWRWVVAVALVLTTASWLIVATRREAGRWHDDFTFSAAGIASAPTAWAPRFTMARALLRAGRWREAAAQVRIGLRFAPAAEPLEVTGALLWASCPEAAVRSGGEALALAQRAARATSYRGPAALEALAAAYAENGDFPRARAAAEKALAVCRAQPRADGKVVRRLMAALALYAGGRPLRLAAADWS
jgi:hypothetical protein